MKNVLMLATMSVALAIFGCEKASEKPATKDEHKPAASSPPVAAKPVAPKPVPEKKNEDDHKEHESGTKGHDDHAENQLGPFDIGGISVKPVIHGSIKAGKEAEVDVHIPQGAEKVVATRVWIGSPDGQGAMKVKATINKENAHNHVAVPDPLPPGSKLCVELEMTGGEKKVGSVELPK